MSGISAGITGDYHVHGIPAGTTGGYHVSGIPADTTGDYHVSGIPAGTTGDYHVSGIPAGTTGGYHVTYTCTVKCLVLLYTCVHNTNSTLQELCMEKVCTLLLMPNIQLETTTVNQIYGDIVISTTAESSPGSTSQETVI